MASTSQQSDSHKGATVSSSYDMGFGESDYESQSSDSDLDDESAMNYWLGKRYFECVIAQCLLVPKNMNQQGMTKIDVLWPPTRVQWQKLIVSQVKLEGTLRGYPYDVGFKELRAHDLGGPGDEVRGVDDAYQAMMIGIGHVVRRGTRDQRTVLLATIRRHTHLLMTSDSESIGGMPERHEWESSSFQITPEGGHTASLPNLGQSPLHGKVAIKTFAGRDANRKLDMLHRVCHERFVSLLEVFESDTAWYAVFEHVVTSLTQVVNSPAYPTERQLAAIVGQVSLN